MSRKRLNKTEFNLNIIDINSKGMGVAKSKEGVVYFVKNVVPGDIVDIRIYKKRRGYFEGEPISWIKKSNQRTIPVCEHFGICGGCKWQHLSYKGQLDYKEKGIINNLRNIGKLDINEILPIRGVKNPFYYRNKMEFSFSNKRWLTSDEINKDTNVDRNGLGFHKPGMWDKVVDINKCHLQADPSNEIRNAIRSYSIEKKFKFFDPHNQSGFLRTLMIRNTLDGEIMVLIQFFKEDKIKRELLLNYIKKSFPKIVSLLYCINSKGNDSIYDQDIFCFKGKDHITEHIDDLQFKITAKSFFQTNPKQADILYGIAKNFASLEPNEIVYDLYTGTGTIALSLAKDCAKVIGIESVKEAIDAARENAKFNQIKNVIFELGDMKYCFDDDFISRHGRADLVITDPPRNGMHADVVQQLLKLAPKKIVYVSCNSSTQARDIKMMKNKYKVVKSQAVDMFPQTHHAENVVLLHLNTNHA
tara:strand:- start:4559 stop:5977 length:1419 start_codon:yes stop_codon:yes gene_type:complete